jgi:hypothetical protein
MKHILILLLLGSLTACASAIDDDGPTDDTPVFFDGKADNLGLTNAEVVAILELVNSAPFEELDKVARLDVRAVHHIFAYRLGPEFEQRENLRAHRPIPDMQTLLSLKWVGARALGKLREHIHNRDMVNDTCVLISEYVEGQGNNNKAIELMNCGGEKISLHDVGVCTIFNNNKECTRSAIVGDLELEPWEVVTICRTREGTFNDPIQPLVEACQIEMSGVMMFTGDDRLVVFQDLDGDGKFDRNKDRALDIFGMPTRRPDPTRYADINIRRTLAFPHLDYDTLTWNDRVWFSSRHNRTDISHFGTAPAKHVE